MGQDIGLGIVLPIERGSTGYFKQSFDVMTQVKSNIVNLLLTKKGERLFNPEFGCDLHNILFENISQETEAQVDAAVKDAINRWLPYVTIKKVQVINDPNKNTVLVQVSFSLRGDISDIVTIIV